MCLQFTFLVVVVVDNDAVLMYFYFYHPLAFGGNQNKITIFGESAGAASVGLQLVSPHSWNYYHQAIMEVSTFRQALFRKLNILLDLPSCT